MSNVIDQFFFCFQLFTIIPWNKRMTNGKTERTYYVHERQDVVLHVLLAVEAYDRVVHGQQHLDVVVVLLGVPPLALGFRQLVLSNVQGSRKAGDAKVCHCKNIPKNQQNHEKLLGSVE